MITTAFQSNAFQQTAFQIVGTLARLERLRMPDQFIGKIPTGALRVINIKPIKNRMV